MVTGRAACGMLTLDHVVDPTTVTCGTGSRDWIWLTSRITRPSTSAGRPISFRGKPAPAAR